VLGTHAVDWCLERGANQRLRRSTYASSPAAECTGWHGAANTAARSSDERTRAARARLRPTSASPSGSGTPSPTNDGKGAAANAETASCGGGWGPAVG
jgi:hypothetical protein